jgi:hypothetical protein
VSFIHRLLVCRRCWCCCCDRWRGSDGATLSGLVAPVATVLMLRSLGAPLPTMNGGFAGDPQLFWTPLQALAPAQLADGLQNLWLIAPLWPFWIAGGAVGLVVPDAKQQ